MGNGREGRRARKKKKRQEEKAGERGKESGELEKRGRGDRSVSIPQERFQEIKCMMTGQTTHVLFLT